MAEIELAKGTKNINSEQKLVRNKVMNVLVKVFELYGYLPLETPTLQRYDVLASKYAGGAEILKETFRLKDQGNRDLALRYDLTVPMCLYVSLNPQVKLPFKRYEVGKVFRDGPISSERFREFWQCDVDVVGTSSILADAEYINIILDVFKELNLVVVVKVNNRKILDEVMEYCSIDKDKRNSATLTIDKLEKIGSDGLKKELKEKKLTSDQIDKLIKLICIEGNNKKKLDFIKKFLKNSEIKTSLVSGGRYDNIIGDFLNNGQKYPAVGISFGLDRIEKAVKLNEKTSTKVYVIPIKQVEKSLEVLEELRSNNINSDMDLMDRSISKNLDYANTLSVPYVVFVGEDEVKKKKFKLRDMKSGKEEMLSVSELIKK